MDNKDSFVIGVLNLHGSFFHRKVINEILAVSLEVLEKEFPIELNNERTKIDIIASDKNCTKYYIIECKKVDNDFKTWVFFQDKKIGDGDKSVVELKSGQPTVIDIIRLVGGQNKLLRTFFTTVNQSITKSLCYEGFEVKIDYEKDGVINISNIHKALNNNNIEKACNQVLSGSRGYALQQMRRSEVTGNGKLAYFIPIVVTTAKLKLCDVEVDNIDLKRGIVIDKERARLKDVDWVIYNYKPNFMLKEENQIPLLSKPEWLNESVDYLMSVYIVNSESLQKFLNEMKYYGM